MRTRTRTQPGHGNCTRHIPVRGACRWVSGLAPTARARLQAPAKNCLFGSRCEREASAEPSDMSPKRNSSKLYTPRVLSHKRKHLARNTSLRHARLRAAEIPGVEGGPASSKNFPGKAGMRIESPSEQRATGTFLLLRPGTAPSGLLTPDPLPQPRPARRDLCWGLQEKPGPPLRRSPTASSQRR